MDIRIKEISKHLKDEYNPDKIYLFGSHAWGTVTPSSDIDLCIVMQYDNDQTKRKILTNMYLSLYDNTDFDIPVDLISYTPSQWNEMIADKQSFAYKIKTEGVCLYERQ